MRRTKYQVAQKVRGDARAGISPQSHRGGVTASRRQLRPVSGQFMYGGWDSVMRLDPVPGPGNSTQALALAPGRRGVSL